MGPTYSGGAEAVRDSAVMASPSERCFMLVVMLRVVLVAVLTAPVRFGRNLRTGCKYFTMLTMLPISQGPPKPVLLGRESVSCDAWLTLCFG